MCFLNAYRFPKDPIRRAAWVSAMKRVTDDGLPWQPSSRSVICSHHFADEMFDMSGERCRLLLTAVPSIFEFSVRWLVSGKLQMVLVHYWMHLIFLFETNNTELPRFQLCMSNMSCFYPVFELKDFCVHTTLQDLLN